MAMKPEKHNDRRGFTLVEIMIVVAIIGLIAVLAVPGFMRARLRSQGNRILNDARQADAAIDQWAMEKGNREGDPVVTTEAANYLNKPWPTNDVIGNQFNYTVVGSSQVQINANTKTALDGVGVDWGRY